MLIEKAPPMIQIAKRINTGPDRQKRYQSTPKGLAKRSAYKRKVRADTIPTFVGVDSEGWGRGDKHRTVLLGCGNKHYLANDRRKGLQWPEVFDFLYHECFEQSSEQIVYVGFYLRYDFNKWLESLPEHKARSLLTKQGKAARRADDRKHYARGQFNAVHLDGWDVDMPAGYKCLKFRPRVCDCYEQSMKCVHEQLPYMYVCDAGPFFQTSLLRVLEDWPQKDRLWTDEEWAVLEYGKNNLRTLDSVRKGSALERKVIQYNELENVVLARIMTRVAEGLHELGIKLPRDKWYGPGPVAATWLTKNGGIKHRDLIKIPEMSEWLDLCRHSFYGGWFEIYSHGIIPGVSYNYDIHSAYPYATTKLPHICEQCHMQRGTGTNKHNSEYMLLHCTVYSKGTRIGAMPYRNSNGSILRPNVTKGWYWERELAAADRAGLVEKVEVDEWVEFIPCGHANPFTDIADLYLMRLGIDKSSPLGIAIKLIINSVYGKFAQSTGGKPFNNWFYASYITSHCRTQILDAIATHPRKADGVFMVATDGICFDSPHPSLPQGELQSNGKRTKPLGEWDATTYEDLCLFKPGVYWDKKGKAELKIKTRGVPAMQFAEGIEEIERTFRLCLTEDCTPGSSWLMTCVDRDFNDGKRGPDFWLDRDWWPQFTVTLPFHMTSCAQALQRNKWSTAGNMQEDMPMAQRSYPAPKRGKVDFDKAGHLSTVIVELDPNNCESIPYKDPSIVYPSMDLGFGIDGGAFDELREIASVARGKPSNYDLDIENIEWTTVWDGGPV
jgi:DNA polymerase type B, organellar and viral